MASGDAPPGFVRITWLGHSTVAIEVGGVRLLTDPLLRERVAHLRRSAPLRTDRATRPDAVLLSHVHWDHLHLPSLHLLGDDVTIVAPRGIGALLRRQGFTDVVEVDVEWRGDVAGLELAATKAEHRARRTPWDRTPSLGYLVDGAMRIYFAGDTDLFPEMEDLAPVDVALLPVAGWGHKVGPGHLDASRAVEALLRIRPRVVVPIHWGTYEPRRLLRRGPSNDLSRLVEFVRLASRHAPETRIVTILPGESALLRPPAEREPAAADAPSPG
jgi:L-ascorbate metabolism protein UlaG (beta-lactamase superfamily)